MNMKNKITFNSGLIRVLATGTFSIEEAKRTFLEVIEAIAHYNAAKVLFDGRKLSGKVATIERFYYGKFAAQETLKLLSERRVSFLPRFAYVLKPPILDPGRFGENVARNRGMTVSTFNNLKDAKSWLKLYAA